MKLRHTNIYERNMGWGQKGWSHKFYTKQISSHFQRTVISSLNKYNIYTHGNSL